MSITRTTSLITALLVFSAVSATASSIVVGSAIDSLNAKVSQQDLRPGSTILNGDSLRVGEGTALVGLDDGSRMTFGKNTTASFQKESSGVTAVLDHGIVNFYHPGDANLPVRLQTADVLVVPGSGFDTLADIAMTADTLIVMTREGSLRVEGGGRSVEVPKGKMITLHSQPARAPQISATTARPAFIHDLKIAAVAVIAAAALAIWINELAEDANDRAACRLFFQLHPPSPVRPVNCDSADD
jgi:hypothetical protein